eukprot:scaffold4850_cov50-Attheya_sp.AAC.2
MLQKSVVQQYLYVLLHTGTNGSLACRIIVFVSEDSEEAFIQIHPAMISGRLEKRNTQRQVNRYSGTVSNKTPHRTGSHRWSDWLSLQHAK